MDEEPLRAHLKRLEAKLDAVTALLCEGGFPRHLLFPASQIAKVCGVSRRTIRRWATDPEHPLTCVHLGHGLATTPSLIDAWLRERWQEERKSPRVGKLWGRTRRSQVPAWRVRVRTLRPEGEEEASPR